MKRSLIASLGLASIAAGVTILWPSNSRAQSATGSGSPADIIRQISEYQSPSEYCAWPSIAKTKQGDLIVLFAKTDEHLGPNGAILLSRSTDNGASWLRPVTVLDSPLDDRESGITSLRDGRIIGHFWSTFHTKESYERLAPNSYERGLLAAWIDAVGKPSYLEARNQSGPSTLISTDDGRSWTSAGKGHDSVHGGIELANGTVLLTSYRETPDSITVHAANRGPFSWRRIATIASPNPDSLGLGEPHIAQLASGRVIMMMRATARPYNDRDPRCVLWETYSDDNGVTWAAPFPTEIWGFPPHLTVLRDGRILCTYGYRRHPYGERACLSTDGVRWNNADEVILRDDAPNGDLGYPASVELEPGTILTVYYQADVPPGTTQRMDPPDPHRTKPGILGTVWRAPRPK
jgi:sialidase-1